MSDLKITLKTSGDDAGAKKVQQSLKEVVNQVEAQGKAAEGAEPKLRKYRDEIHRTGVVSQELKNVSGAAAKQTFSIGDALSSLAQKFTVGAVAVLGFKKVINAIGQAPELQAFHQNLHDASAALGSTIVNSGLGKATIGALSNALAEFAASTAKAVAPLPPFVANLEKGKDAAQGQANAYEALTASLQDLATRYGEVNQQSEIHLQQALAQLEAEKQLALERNNAETDPLKRIANQGKIEEDFTKRANGLQNSHRKEMAKRLKDQGNAIAEGGVMGFDTLPTEEEFIAKGAKVGELGRDREDARQRLNAAEQKLIESERIASMGEAFSPLTRLGTAMRRAIPIDLPWSDKLQGTWLANLDRPEELPSSLEITGAKSRIPLIKEQIALAKADYDRAEQQLRQEGGTLDPRVRDAASAKAVYAEISGRDAMGRVVASRLAEPFFNQSRQLTGEQVAQNSLQPTVLKTLSARNSAELQLAQIERANEIQQRLVAAYGENAQNSQEFYRQIVLNNLMLVQSLNQLKEQVKGLR